MFNTRSLQFFILISLSLHALLLTVFSIVHFKKTSKISRLFEVQYYTVPPKKITTAKVATHEVSVVQERKLEQKFDILSSKSDRMNLGDEIRSVEKSPDVIKLNRKEAPKINLSDRWEKRINVALSRSDKITNPQYLNYKEITSQKIRQRLMMYYDKEKHSKGENMLITFLLDASGNVRDVKIIEGKTNASDYLKEIALKSVRESSPFVDFPKGLHYENLTFNLEIVIVENADRN